MTHSPSSGHYDVAIIGAGIVGLAHALAAARQGLRAVVIERDAKANGASIRNFGFITVTGQQAGVCWQRAMRTRDIWADVAAAANIPIEQQGLVVAARRPEAGEVLEAFCATDMGQDCRLLTGAEARLIVPQLQKNIHAALWSPHELRVESRTAIPQLSAWLEQQWGVTFFYSTHVHAATAPRVETSRGLITAEKIILCSGHDFRTLFPQRFAAYNLTTCKLQMLRLTTSSAQPLGAAVMSDLGLVRYLGYAELPQAQALKQRLEAEQGEALQHGVHLIVVQSGDGSLVVGDSHHYGETTDPFGQTLVDDIIMHEFDQVLDLPDRRMSERWIGVYASAADRLMLVDKPDAATRIVTITSGTGASTAFAIAESVIAELV